MKMIVIHFINLRFSIKRGFFRIKETKEIIVLHQLPSPGFFVQHVLYRGTDVRLKEPEPWSRLARIIVGYSDCSPPLTGQE